MAKNNEQMIEYLAGVEIPLDLAYSRTKDNKPKYKLANPIKEYWQQVNRFMFSGGISVDVVDATEDDVRQLFVNEFLEFNRLEAHLFSLFKKLSVYGEMLVTLTLTTTNNYIVNYYTKNEFTYTLDQGTITSVSIYAQRIHENKPHIFKQDYTLKETINYPLVPLEKVNNFKWDKYKSPTPNNYKELPLVVIKNHIELDNDRGVGDFDANALEIICSYFNILFDVYENAHFMGDPILQSPDPELTIAELNNKKKVITKFEPDDGGETKPLTITPIPSEVLVFLKELESNFKKCMGVKHTEDDTTKETSSIALKTLNAMTISVAEEKWSYIVDNGIVELIEKALLFAHIDGIIRGESVGDEITINRSKPYFPETNQEKLTRVTIADQLMVLGVNKPTALKEFYTDLTLEEIGNLLSDNEEF